MDIYLGNTAVTPTPVSTVPTDWPAQECSVLPQRGAENITDSGPPQMVNIITKTCPCNIYKKKFGCKMKIFTGKKLIFFLILFKTLIVGTC